ncbi:MAG TPA: tRNA preQ1(34) S-adenosylmethionine ribosyltransferase-isomerase QueA [Steroidobacteraceae bacterium]|nr:tRNA preQ1(34) S-adenosylmethionine ribosyltransferase-isomerase QueA [Steroidobacteraceae bacterium]
MQRRDFAYELPDELIAQEPLATRSASRLLVLDGQTGALRDGHIEDLAELLAPGDLLIFNDTRVVAARILGTKPTGGRIEMLLERPLEADLALVQLKSGKPSRAGLIFETAGGQVTLVERRGELWCVQLPAPALEYFERWGSVPLPPYIRRIPDANDLARYQSIFARAHGAVAAPTASLHFDAPLMARLEARGVERSFITLHVGAGTFQPMRVENLDAHVMHAERVTVPAATCAAVSRARARGGRIVAVGTTVVRALESAALESGALAPWSGETQLFICPGFRFRSVDAMITNFHLPESTLLMLVCAFAGRESVLRAYRHAVEQRYRFFSYGDAMFVTPARADPAHAAAL